MCDTVIRGYKTLAGYEGPYMARRRELMRACANKYRPALAGLKRFAHSARTRRLTEDVMAKYDAELGPISIKQRILSTVAMAFAHREAARVAAKKNIYQPSLRRTKYRMSAKDLVVERLRGKKLTNLLDLEINWDRMPVQVTLDGILDRVNAKALGAKIGRYLRKQGGELLVNLDRLVTIEDGALTRLLKKIKRYQGRARIVLAEEANIVRQAVARLPESLAWLVVTNCGELSFCQRRAES
jgi:hypothetical protein